MRHFYIKTNVLPRQARDKHRENSKNERPFFIRFRKPNVYAAVRRRKQHKTHTQMSCHVMLLQRSGSASFIPWVLMIYYLRLSRGELSRPTSCLGKSPCVRPESSHQKVSCCFASRRALRWRPSHRHTSTMHGSRCTAGRENHERFLGIQTTFHEKTRRLICQDRLGTNRNTTSVFEHESHVTLSGDLYEHA